VLNDHNGLDVSHRSTSTRCEPRPTIRAPSRRRLRTRRVTASVGAMASPCCTGSSIRVGDPGTAEWSPARGSSARWPTMRTATIGEVLGWEGVALGSRRASNSTHAGWGGEENGGGCWIASSTGSMLAVSRWVRISAADRVWRSDAAVRAMGHNLSPTCAASEILGRALGGW